MGENSSISTINNFEIWSGHVYNAQGTHKFLNSDFRSEFLSKTYAFYKGYSYQKVISNNALLDKKKKHMLKIYLSENSINSNCCQTVLGGFVPY